MFRFRMNERSLFAVLLRSPWWISLLIALLISLVARALLPGDYALAVMLGTTPFVVIAALAAWRQWRAPSAARLDAALERLATLGWRDFAAEVAQVYAQQGYVVTPLDGQAADFRLERAGQVSLLSCRRWKAARHGGEALRALQAACEPQGARGIYLSLVPVSDAALRLAQQSGLQLLHGRALAQLFVVA